MDNQNYMPGIAPEEKTDKGNFGWAVLGFFFPLIGLILFLVWKDTKHGDAKKAGVGALVGFLVSVFMPIILGALFYFFGWNSIQNSVVQQTCDTYGSNYEAREVKGVWECYNTVTGETIRINTAE